MSKVYQQISSSSQWALNGNQVEFKTVTTTSTFDRTLREWIKSEPVVTWQKPSDLGYTKQAEFYIVTFDEVPSIKKRGLKEKLYFKEKVTAKVRDDYPFTYLWLNTDTQNICGENIPLNQFFMKDINNGRCSKMPLADSEYVKVIKEESEAISAKEAQELSQKWNYVFDAVESDNGDDIYRDNVSKFIKNPM